MSETVRQLHCLQTAGRNCGNMSASSTVRGVVFAALLFITSFVGILFFSVFTTPVWLIRPGLYRYISDRLIATWEVYIVALLEVFLNIRVIISGDRIRPNECNVIMMNHRTRLDWMYFWCVLARQSGSSTEKIILKSPLKHIPGAGWAMQQVAFMFLDRKWDHDRKVMTQLMNHYSDLNVNMQILIYPEGTDLTTDTKERSHAYAKKYDLDCYEYVLHPRTTGVTYLIDYMRNNGMLDAVYDVTIAYPYQFPQTEAELVFGCFPTEIHFHIERHGISKIPATAAEIRTWCEKCWALKEKRLQRFYEMKRFTNVKVTEAPTRWQRLLLWVVAIGWTLVAAGVIALFFWSWVVRWLMGVQMVFYIVMDCCGGFELMQVKYYNYFHTPSKSS